MSSDKRNKHYYSALNKIAAQIVRSNPSLTHEEARRKLADHLERSQRKKEK